MLTVSTPEFWPAATSNRGGVRRSCARGDGSTRQGHQEVAHALAHPGKPTEGRGVAGVCRKRARGGGRSSVALGTGVVVHGRSSGGVLGAPANVLSTVTLSDAAEVGSSHGGDEAQRRRASVGVAKGARGGNRQRGERGWVEELTVRSSVISACSGRLDDG